MTTPTATETRATIFQQQFNGDWRERFLTDSEIVFKSIRERLKVISEDRKRKPVYRYKKVRRATIELVKALTGDYSITKDQLHNYKSRDLISAKSKEYLRGLVYELDENEKAGLHNWLVFTEAVMADMLELLEEASKK
jgi:hypothetical protein